MVDKTKHKYAWWPTIDMEINCFCGEQMQVSSGWDGDDYTHVRCKNCGQIFVVTLVIVPVEEQDAKENN